MKVTKNANSIFDIGSRLLLPKGQIPTLEAARVYLQLAFSEDDRDRMHELAAKAREGSLTPDEQVEIRQYEQIGDLLSLMKSKARLRLKQSPETNGSAH